MSSDLISALQCNICMVIRSYELENSMENPGRPLNSCSGCNMIRYCGPQHQTMDWAMHRNICAHLQKICKRYNLAHPLEISGIPKSKDDIEKAALQLKYILKEKLDRGLAFFEEELLSIPAYCPICFQVKKLKVICPICAHQAYCSEEHRLQHKEKHAKDCSILFLYYCPYKTMPVKAQPHVNLIQRVENFQDSDIAEAFEEAYHCSVPDKPAKSYMEYQLFSYICDHSCIFTLCYALSHLKMTYLKGTTFVVFVVGAALEPLLWFMEHHFRFFFNQYPDIVRLDMHFIGPDVKKPTNGRMKFMHLGVNRTVNILVFRDVFQNYCQNFKVKPHVIISYNCGYSEYSPFFEFTVEDSLDSSLSQDTWFLGLVQMLQILHTPIFFTSFTKREGYFDLAAVHNAAGALKQKVHVEPILKVTENPFRDLRPCRQWCLGTEETFFYRNGYIQGIRTKLLR